MKEYDWTNRIIYTLRVYARQGHDAHLRMHDERYKIEDALENLPCVLETTHPIPYYWPIREEDKDKFQKRGLVLTEINDKWCLLIKQIDFIIKYDKDEMVILDAIHEVCGDIFASIKIERMSVRDIQAI